MRQINNKLKKILIIGGSGAIGKSIYKFIQNKKKKIYKCINYSRSNRKNILKIKKLPKSDYILYLIKNNNTNKSLQYFNHFKKLLLKSSKNKKIIFFSSGAVYGPRKVKKKFKENEIVNLNKINKFKGYKKNYAKEKILLEKEFQKTSSEGYNISIIRGFTFYGKYILEKNYLISEIINAVKLNKKLIIKNQNVMRSYMHTDDMTRWILKIMKYASQKCPIYNIGSDKIINLEKLTLYLNNKYGSKILIKKTNQKKIDFYIPSIDLAKKKFKLKNTINFNNAIELLINLK